MRGTLGVHGAQMEAMWRVYGLQEEGWGVCRWMRHMQVHGALLISIPDIASTCSASPSPYCPMPPIALIALCIPPPCPATVVQMQLKYEARHKEHAHCTRPICTTHAPLHCPCSPHRWGPR